jgi:hypothetical protein
MSHYENSGPGGVGKRYGALDLGGISGITRGNNGEYFLDFETSAPEAEALNGQTFQIPSSYGLISSVYVEVEEGFIGGTLDILYDGSSILSGPVDLTTEGLVDGALASLLSIETGKEITVVVTGVDSSVGAPGYVKTLIKVNRI